MTFLVLWSIFGVYVGIMLMILLRLLASRHGQERNTKIATDHPREIQLRMHVSSLYALVRHTAYVSRCIQDGRIEVRVVRLLSLQVGTICQNGYDWLPIDLSWQRSIIDRPRRLSRD